MKYEIDIPKEDLINCYTNQWVLEWCKQNHPEIFEKAKKIIKEYVEEDE
jgi:hypothetical protein